MTLDRPHSPPRLSKSRYQTGLQCPKKLWLACLDPHRADPADEIRAAIFAQGQRVGEVARERFRGGVLVGEDHTQIAAALATTARLIAGGAACLFEAAFEHTGVLVRADVITRHADGMWDLVEVKSTGSVKPEHITDVAIQLYVLEGAGLPVRTAGVLHLDTGYEYGGGAYDLGALFALQDVTAEARALAAEIPHRLAAMRATLEAECPDTRVGKHCTRPYQCDFHGHCHKHLPEFPVTEIPRIHAEVLDSLLAAGIHSMRQVPPDYPGLSASQDAICEITRGDGPRFLPGLAAELGRLRFPLHFLDFETIGPALPLHAGTRPYQPLPVQWSCHTLHGDGTLSHAEFLHEERSDPRGDFAASLLRTLPPDGSIVVYSNYEATVLRSLAQDLPSMASSIDAVGERLYDLLPVVRDCVRHPRFAGRASLKVVLPALVDGFSYDELTIRNGAVAGLRYAAALEGDLPDDERRRLFADLRAYCATDTLALVRLFETLKAETDRATSVPPRP